MTVGQRHKSELCASKGLITCPIPSALTREYLARQQRWGKGDCRGIIHTGIIRPCDYLGGHVRFHERTPAEEPSESICSAMMGPESHS